MTILIVTPDRNTPGKKDYSGAFKPEATLFARFHKLRLSDHLLEVDLSRPLAERKKQVLGAIRARTDLTMVAFFCHGLSRKLPQFGLTTANVAGLAAAIASRSRTDVRIALYACSTAEGGPAGDNGFADSLRDALCVAGASHCQVDAHERAGHTTRNPFVRRFEGLGSAVGGPGGYYIVTPGGPRWKRWRDKLHGDLRFEFPFLSTADIQARV